MSTEVNKALVRRYIEDVWHQGNLAALDDYLAADYRRYVSPTAPPLTPDGQKQRLAGFRSAFPDIALTLEDVLAEGDRVVFRTTMRGTHEGAFQTIPPTGTRVTVALLDHGPHSARPHCRTVGWSRSVGSAAAVGRHDRFTAAAAAELAGGTTGSER